MYQLATNPWVVLASILIGAVLGLAWPDFSRELEFIGTIYVDLLKMIVLPFMVSAVIFSLQKLLRDGGTVEILRRTSLVFVAALVVVGVLAFSGHFVLQSFAAPDKSELEAFGRIVGSSAQSNDTVVRLSGELPTHKPSVVETLRTSLIPTNIFSALAQGEALKTLVFSIFFGLAIGGIGGSVSAGLGRALESVYQACQKMTRWLNYPLPLALVCMTASQLAITGTEPLKAMVGFLAEMAFSSLVVLALAVVILHRRSGQSIKQTLAALKTPFALAVATRSSATCMPAMIDALTQNLRFQRERVELLVPLSVSLLRIGPVVYYVCATLFVAQLYQRTLTPADFLLVGAASILAGCASAGMTGLVTVSLTSMVCAYLGLPFEAAFVLFLAVDPVCDMLRTLILVIGNTAAVSAICEPPSELERRPS